MIFDRTLKGRNHEMKILEDNVLPISNNDYIRLKNTQIERIMLENKNVSLPKATHGIISSPGMIGFDGGG
jgi:hypothetical protein